MASASKQIEAKLNQSLSDLSAEELRLFRAYNRHGNSESKLKILDALKVVIIKQDALKILK